MSIFTEERHSDSPYVAGVTHGWTLSDGSPTRPAEINWHLVIAKHSGGTHVMVVGPWDSSGIVHYGEGAEILWLRFRLGVYMPHLPTRDFLNSEIVLPSAVRQSFWLNSTAWQLPDYENADTFADRLMREDVLAYDPLVDAVLEGQPHDLSARTVRHRFLRTTGLTQTQIFQVQRARRAQTMLESGTSILDTVDEAGYYDQPHLTRALKQWVGYTPAQIIDKMKVACNLLPNGDPVPADASHLALIG